MAVFIGKAEQSPGKLLRAVVVTNQHRSEGQHKPCGLPARFHARCLQQMIDRTLVGDRVAFLRNEVRQAQKVVIEYEVRQKVDGSMFYLQRVLQLATTHVNVPSQRK